MVQGIRQRKFQRNPRNWIRYNCVTDVARAITHLPYEETTRRLRLNQRNNSHISPSFMRKGRWFTCKRVDMLLVSSMDHLRKGCA